VQPELTVAEQESQNRTSAARGGTGRTQQARSAQPMRPEHEIMYLGKRSTIVLTERNAGRGRTRRFLVGSSATEAEAVAAGQRKKKSRRTPRRLAGRNG
jgi:hypothetical protein